jgi:hypothetical protein
MAKAGKGTGKHKAADSGDDSGDDTASQEASASGSEESSGEPEPEEESPKGSKRGTGKFKTASGKFKSASGKAAGLKKSTGRMKSVGPKLSGHELVPVVCSECYEELTYDSGSTATEIVCPVCEHSAGKPDDATLHHIADKRRTESKNFKVAFLMFAAGGAGWLSWAVLAQNPANAADSGLFWGPAGLGILAFLTAFIFIWKYETSRWETYF